MFIPCVSRCHDRQGAEHLFAQAQDAIKQKNLPAMQRLAPHLLWGVVEEQRGARVLLKDMMAALHAVGGDNAVRPVLVEAALLNVVIPAPFPTH